MAATAARPPRAVANTAEMKNPRATSDIANAPARSSRARNEAKLKNCRRTVVTTRNVADASELLVLSAAVPAKQRLTLVHCLT